MKTNNSLELAKINKKHDLKVQEYSWNFLYLGWHTHFHE